MFHIISDLYLDTFDKAENQHLLPEGCTFCVIAGNISGDLRRSLLFAESLATKYQNVHILYNYGLLESKGKEYFKVRDAFTARLSLSGKSPLNLTLPKGKIINNFNFYATEGFPFLTEDEFYKSVYSKKFIIAKDENLFIGDRLVSSRYDRLFSYDYYMSLYKLEKTKLESWISESKSYKKVLISSIGNDSSLLIETSNYKMFPYLNLKDLIWISGGDNFAHIQHENSKIITVPGKDRTNLFVF